MYRFRIVALLLAVVILAGCAGAETEKGATAPAGAPYLCILPWEQRMLVAELFFGRSVRGRRPVSEAEWADFVDRVVVPNFPAGFTSFDAAGGWADPAGRSVRDKTKVLLVAAKRTADLAGRLSAVIDAYKSRFRQQSVGIITRDSCAAF